MKILIVYYHHKPAHYISNETVEFVYFRYLDSFESLIGKTFDAVVMEHEASLDPRINQYIKDKVTIVDKKS